VSSKPEYHAPHTYSLQHMLATGWDLSGFKARVWKCPPPLSPPPPLQSTVLVRPPTFNALCPCLLLHVACTVCVSCPGLLM
jgi:hypothetical protein